MTSGRVYHSRAVVGGTVPQLVILSQALVILSAAKDLAGRAFDAREPFVEPPHQVSRQRLAAGHHLAQREVTRLLLQARIVQERLEHRGHEVGGGDALLGHHLAQVGRVFVAFGSRHDQRGTGGERPEQLPHRDVEARRGLLEDAIAGAQVVLVLHPPQPVGDAAVGVHHPLGPAGRARGVDDVGQVARRDGGGVLSRRLHIALDRDRNWPYGLGRPVERLPFGGQNQKLASTARPVPARQILGHARQSLGRVGGVEGHVGGACLEDGEEADRQLERALDGDAHGHVRPGAEVGQAGGEGLGAAVQLGVGEGRALGHHGDRVRGAGDLLGEHAVQQLAAVVALRRAVPLGHRLLALGRREQRDRVVAAVRVRGERGERALVVAGRGGHQRGVEVRGPVVEGEGHAAARRIDLEVRGEREVGLFVAAVAQHLGLRSAAGRQARLHLLVDVVVDEVEDRLEELPPALPALQLDQRVAAEGEERPLAFEGLEHQRFPGAAAELQAQRQRVEEQAQGALTLGALRPAVDDDARHHVRLAGEERQHPQVDGEEHALDRHGERARQGLDAAAERGVEGHVERHGVPIWAPVALRARPARLPGQLGEGAAFELAVPEGVRLGGGQHLALQRHELAEGHRRRGRRHSLGGVPAGQLGGVALEQLGEERGGAPAVEHRVVEGEAELKALLGEALPRLVAPQAVYQEAGEGRPRPVEALEALHPQVGGDQLGVQRRVHCREVDEGERRPHPPVDELQGLARTVEVERGAEQRVAVHHRLHRTGESAHAERRPQAEAVLVVVDGGAGGELAVEEHAGLEADQRVGVLEAGGQPCAVRGGHQLEGRGLRPPCAVPTAALEHAGELAHRRMVEDLLQAQLVAALLGERQHLHDADRVATQGEEGVVDADSLDAQHPRPDLGQELLLEVARGGVGRLGAGRREVRGGQRLAVDLAVRGERQGFEEHEGRRHHVLGERGAEVGGEVGCRGRRAAGDHVGHQAVAAGPALSGRGLAVDGHHRLGHARVGGERGLDLTQLDAVAAQLDLLVDAAEELQHSAGELPARQQPHQVAGAIEALSRLGGGEGVRQEALGGEAGAAEVAARHAPAADQQLARDPRRHGRELAVDHVEAQVGDRPADRHCAFDRLPRCHRVDRAADHRLGGAVLVDHRGARREGTALGQALAEQRLAAHHQRLHPARFGIVGEEPPQHLEVRRRELQQAAPGAAAEGLGERREVFFLGQQRHRGAGRERCEEAGHGEVEADRGVDQRAAALGHLVGRAREGEVVGETGVRHHHALGPAGRARGVEHVGQALRSGGREGRRGGTRGALAASPGIEVQGLDPCACQAGRQALAGHDQRGVRIAQHEGQPVVRVGGVERQVGGAGLVNGDERHHQLGRARQQHADHGLGPHTARRELGRQLRRLGRQAGVGEVALARHHRHGVRQLRRPRREPGGKGRVLGERLRRVVEVEKGLPLLLRRQQRERTHRRLGPARQLAEEARQALAQAVDLGRRVERRVVLQGELDTAAGFAHREPQAEALAPAAALVGGQGQRPGVERLRFRLVAEGEARAVRRDLRGEKLPGEEILPLGRLGQGRTGSCHCRGERRRLGDRHGHREVAGVEAHGAGEVLAGAAVEEGRDRQSPAAGEPCEERMPGRERHRLAARAERLGERRDAHSRARQGHAGGKEGPALRRLGARERQAHSRGSRPLSG